ncbi:MAG TPA: phospholipid carrier-dependent glycosyltransferase [Myxococcota bacterium]|nr:phospholipid carrier-dependent glycosyltransferase [Myxococcota bacterium]
MSSLGASEIAGSVRSLSAGANRARALAGLLLLGIAASYFATIGARPFVAPDEFRYAEVAREMLASGDWIVPRLDGVLYFEKPALGYWVTALSIRAFGENPFAVRLPFVIATLLTAAITFGLVRRFGSGGRAAGWAALGLLTCAEVAVIGTTAVLDALFSLGVTAALAALFAAMQQPSGAARQRWLVASGGACGAAFLTKGFLAFAIPICVAAPYLVWSRRSRELLRLPWIPLAVALAIAAPWTLAIARAQPDFWHQFVVNEHLRRFAGADPQHDEPIWYFLPVLAAGALPWTSLLAPALRRRAALAATPLSRFCACWLIAPVILLSASSGKLATYVLPCFPALFVLVAEAAVAQPRLDLSRRLAWIAAALAALGVAAAAVLLWPPSALAGYYDAAEPGTREIGAIAVLAAAAIAASALRWPDPAPRAAAIAAAVSLGFATAGVAFPTGEVSRTPGRWLAERVAPVPADAIVVADRNLVHAVCWQLRRSDVRVLWSAGELYYGLERTDDRERWLNYQQLDALIRDPARARPVVVIGRSGRSFLPVGLTPDRSEIGLAAFFGEYDPPVRLGGST